MERVHTAERIIILHVFIAAKDTGTEKGVKSVFLFAAFPRTLAIYK